MTGLRLILVVLLLAGITQLHGWGIKDEIHAYINTQAAPDPDSAIKGRLLTVAEGCGLPVTVKKARVKRVVGGDAATNGAWPWLALLGQRNETHLLFHCGGSVITTRHVLTAGHCFNSTLDFVRLGEYDILKHTDGKHIDVAYNRIVKHEEYDSNDSINDIAIVILAKDVEFTERIRPICLPTSKDMRSRSFVGERPFVAGWGKLQEKSRGITNLLQQVQVPVIGNDECMYKYIRYNKNIRRVAYRFGKKYALCAGFAEGGKDACQGDSGGPLILPIFEDNRFPYYLIGIVSFGAGCARKNIPGVYTNVQEYIDWIDGKLK